MPTLSMSYGESSVLLNFPAAKDTVGGLTWPSLHHRTINHDISLCPLVVVSNCFFFFLQLKVYLCSPGYPQTQNPSVSASLVLALQPCDVLLEDNRKPLARNIRETQYLGF